MSHRARARHETLIRAGVRAAAVALLVLGAYVVVLIPLAGGHSNLAPSIVATALVVAASSYLRRPLDRAVDHFVHGARADAFDDLQRFASKSAEAVDPQAVPVRVVETAHRLVAAHHAELQLHLPGGRTLHTAWPPHSTSDELDFVVPVRHDGSPIGLLAVAKQPGDPMSPSDEQLLNRLAQAASVALDNARLAIELREQVDEIARVVDELQRSSARIVSAGENEQRRIERAIRQRVERPLRRARASARLAFAVAVTRPEAARDAVTSASVETTEALVALRDVAHGVFPPLLASEGLAKALAGRARREGWMVEVCGAGFDDSQLEPEVRSTAYFALVELARAATTSERVAIALCGDDQFVRATVRGAGAAGDAELDRALERVHILGGRVTEGDEGLSIALPYASSV